MLEILIIAFGILVAAGLFIFIIQPIWEGSALLAKEDIPLPVDDLDELYAKRDAIYEAIKELELDYQVGKLSEEDYKRFSADLKRQAAEILKRIDEFPKQQAHIRRYLEAQIQTIRAAMGAPVTQPVLARVPITGREGKTPPKFCTQCGAPLRPTDRFCSQCGARVTPA
ncbi:MAG: zinc-ribbon domain-containing protein [Chloroflexi bacterium]|nr:zinc-ribbon domain-containing protein [Chloroflexota bacterium]